MGEIAKVDSVSSAEIIIDRSPEVIWDYLLDQGPWMKDLCIETVEGEVNKEGELRKAVMREWDENAQPFFLKPLG